MAPARRNHGVHKWLAYATEIGEAGLRFPFTELGVQGVVSCAESHNRRSRAVMERIGLHYMGEIGGDGPIEGVLDDSRYAVHALLRTRWRHRRRKCSPNR